MLSDTQRIMLNITAEGRFKPAWQTLACSLPTGETRELWINGVPGSRFTLE
jgi:alpha-glucosidase